MHYAERTTRLIFECIGHAGRGMGASVATILDFLANNGDTTSLRGVTLIVEHMEDNGWIQRSGVRSYGPTPLGIRMFARPVR